MVAAADPAPPPLTDAQAAILNAFIASNYDLAATAESAILTLPDLLSWHRAPAVQAALDDFESLQARADELQLAAARRDAVKELHGILRDAESDLIERRRAATALLRRNTRGIGFQPMSNRRGQSPLAAAATQIKPSALASRGQDPAIPAVPDSAIEQLENTAIARSLAVLDASIDALEASATAAAASTPSEISNLKSQISASSQHPDRKRELPSLPDPLADDYDPLEDPALLGDPALRNHLANLLRASRIHPPPSPHNSA
jgi:hypothetical protein